MLRRRPQLPASHRPSPPHRPRSAPAGPGSAGPVVECAACGTRCAPDALDRPTTTRFSAMLREAVHTVTLAVLAAGGATSRTVLETAAATVRDAGLDDCSQEQLFTIVEVLAADTGPDGGNDPAVEACGAALAIELHEVLKPLAPHLAVMRPRDGAAAGREDRARRRPVHPGGAPGADHGGRRPPALPRRDGEAARGGAYAFVGPWRSPTGRRPRSGRTAAVEPAPGPVPGCGTMGA